MWATIPLWAPISHVGLIYPCELLYNMWAPIPLWTQCGPLYCILVSSYITCGPLYPCEFLSWLGICSLIFRANRSFFESERVKVRFALFKIELRERMSSFTMIHSFALVIKRRKAWWKERIWSESLLKRAIHSFKKSESLPSLFTLKRHTLHYVYILVSSSWLRGPTLPSIWLWSMSIVHVQWIVP